MMEILENEGIHFKKVHIDRSFPYEKLPTRKPETALLTEYLNDEYDLASSFVIGDRLTDVQLAKNLGAKAIFLQNKTCIQAESAPGAVLQHSSGTEYNPEALGYGVESISYHWEQILQFLDLPRRRATPRRATRETDIFISLDLDGSGKSDIHTGLGFFDHMLDQIGRHGGLYRTIAAKGDLHIEAHHREEDTALTLGETYARALGDNRGIERNGFGRP